MKIENGKVRYGGDLDKEGLEALSRAPNPNDIFDNMDSFNQEIEQTQATMGVPDSFSESLRKPLGDAPVKEKPRSVIVDNIAEGRRLKPTRKENKVLSITKEEKEEMKLNKSFEDDLNEFSKKLESPKVPEPTPQDPKEFIVELLSKINGPNINQINVWERELGKDSLHFTVFSENEIYVYTHLTRAMWKKVQETFQQLRERKNEVEEEEFKELVVKHCMKWPILSTEWKYNSRAGVVNSLFDSIWYKSYFLTPQQVNTITFSL